MEPRHDAEHKKKNFESRTQILIEKYDYTVKYFFLNLQYL